MGANLSYTRMYNQENLSFHLWATIQVFIPGLVINSPKLFYIYLNCGEEFPFYIVENKIYIVLYLRTFYIVKSNSYIFGTPKNLANYVNLLTLAFSG